MLSDELLFEFYDGYADESNFLDKMVRRREAKLRESGG